MKISLPARVHHPGVLVCLVIGGRLFADWFPIFDALDQIEALCDEAGFTMAVLQGGTPGAARLARTWAWHNNIRLIAEPLDWQRHGPLVGARHNQCAIDRYKPDICLAMLPGGDGTNDMVARCAAARIPIFTNDGADDGRD